MLFNFNYLSVFYSFGNLMFLTETPRNVDIILDGSLSFEARSLYLLIQSLEQNNQANGVLIVLLVATSNWSQEKVEELLSELMINLLVVAVNVNIGLYRTEPYHQEFFDQSQGPATFPSVLSREEVSALLDNYPVSS